MPLLEIVAVKSNFQSHPGVLRAQPPIHNIFLSRFSYGIDRRLTSIWKSLNIHRKMSSETGRSRLEIKAVSTLELKRLALSEDSSMSRKVSHVCPEASPCTQIVESSSEDSKELDEREKSRRLRISKANKGNTPWNKGRKHSAETLQRIRERTKLAMQNPKVKVKMKLVNLGHAQSEETRQKISDGVRIGWQKRRRKMVVQEYCYFEWENLIAEASRRGCTDERELQWDSYDTLNEQLEQEWLESIEERKTMLRQKGNKNRPKSLDQRRKIAEAIAAKWADPAYRERVCSGLSRYHGVTVDVERKPRRRPSSSTESSGQSPPKRKSSEEHDTSRRDPKSQIQRIRLKRSNTPLFKDPLASSKLEMIKNIRAERATSETNRTAAIERARFFITEAEKAAKALEVAATRSPAARASLVETKKLIAEAIQSMESIKTRTTCLVESVSLSSNQSLPCPQHHSQVLSELNDQTHGEERKVNGTAVQLQNPEEVTFKAGYEHPESFNQFQPEESIEKDVKSAGLNDCHSWKEVLLPNGIKHPVASSEENLPREPHRTPMKKWVRGRLVEVME